MGSTPNETTIAAIERALFEECARTVLVEGAPGTGKTWLTVALACRAACSLEAHQRALVLTFSVNGADQIARTLQKWRTENPGKSERVEVLNYHALYKRILDAYVRYCGVKTPWRTWLPHEVAEAMRSLQWPQGKTLAEVRKAIPLAEWELANGLSIRDGLMDHVESPPLLAQSGYEDVLAGAWDILERQSREGLLGYDSWPYFAHRILYESAVLRRRIGGRYPFVFVDEFQDTTGIEWEFIRVLADGSRLVCMADRDQAIYRFRGANPVIRLQRLGSERDLPEDACFVLSEHVRTQDGSPLAGAATALRTVCSAVADGRAYRFDQRAFEVRSVAKVKHGEAEGATKGEWPVSYSAALKKEARTAAQGGSRVAILCPTWDVLHALSHALLGRHGDGQPLYHAIVGVEEQVGAFLSSLAWCAAGGLGCHNAEEALQEAGRALETLVRVGIAKDKAADWFSPAAATLTAKTNTQRRDRVRGALRCFMEGSGQARPIAGALHGLGAQVLSEAGRGLKSPMWLMSRSMTASLRRWSGQIAEYERRSPGAAGPDLLASAWSAIEGCVARERRLVPQARVLLMTAHAAKGKEVELTFLCGASRGTPNMHARTPSDEACDDVRNTFYVACTRSRERVVILHKKGAPSCILERLQGKPCHRTSGSA